MMVLWREIRGLLRGGLRKRERGRQGGKGSGIPRGGGLRANSPLGIPVLLFTVFLFQLLHLHGADLQREAE